MLTGVLAAHVGGTAAVFGLPQGIAPMAPQLPLSHAASFAAALLATTVAVTALLSLVARRLGARAPAAERAEELDEARKTEQTPLTGTPPPALPDAQKLAALSTATDLFIGLLFALGLGVSGMIKPSKVAGGRG